MSAASAAASAAGSAGTSSAQGCGRSSDTDRTASAAPDLPFDLLLVFGRGMAFLQIRMERPVAPEGPDEA
jgi:hypothetical protein